MVVRSNQRLDNDTPYTQPYITGWKNEINEVWLTAVLTFTVLSLLHFPGKQKHTRTCLTTRYYIMLPHRAGAAMEKKRQKIDFLTAVGLRLIIIVITITVIQPRKNLIGVHVLTTLYCILFCCIHLFISWLPFGESWSFFVLSALKRNEQAKKEWNVYGWMNGHPRLFQFYYI